VFLYVLSWKLSNRLDSDFCVDALEEALAQSSRRFSTATRGVQFTSEAFTSRLLSRAVAISMDGRGRALDHAFIERRCGGR
jgi:putative transposase